LVLEITVSDGRWSRARSLLPGCVISL